jgi:ribosomal protein S18 acetylase RimI-like enzyme
MSAFVIRPAVWSDRAAAYEVCLRTGDAGNDGEPFYREDPDALGRTYVGPYLAFEPELALVVADDRGVCGYALGALDSRAFYARYEQEWRPDLCARFPAPLRDPAGWTRVQQAHHDYHNPDYFCPEPYDRHPSHLHIDLLARAQGHGLGRRMLDGVMQRMRDRGSPGAHLGVNMRNVRAQGFYRHLGFRELTRVGTEAAGCIYMGISLPRERGGPDAAGVRSEVSKP